MTRIYFLTVASCGVPERKFKTSCACESSYESNLRGPFTKVEAGSQGSSCAASGEDIYDGRQVMGSPILYAGLRYGG